MPLEKCEEEIILLAKCEGLDELKLDEDDFENVDVSETPALYEGNEYKSYLYNVDEEEDLFNIDETILYLMKEGRLINIENKEIQNKIVTIKDVKGKTRKLVYTWNKEKKEYRARSYPEEDVSDILGKYPDEKKHFYGFCLENWLRRGCLGWL